MAKYEKNEVIKPIILTDTETNDKYTLEFNRESVKFAEDRGFNIDDVTRYPMVKSIELFWFAFRMHHKSISKEKAERILFDDMGGMPKGMLERLIQLYNEPFNTLVSDDEEGEVKNSKMMVEF